MRLIIVSNRLPITAIKIGEGYALNPSVGGLATGLNSYVNSSKNKKLIGEDCIWIGWPGLDVPKGDQSVFEESLKRKNNFVPVFLNETQILNYYSGFCNNVLWPLFHCFPSHIRSKEKYWVEYKKVNEVFLEAVLKIINEDDVLWIHDYHLFLLAQRVRKTYPKLTIGFFLHIPFPSTELFQFIPNSYRKELLEGVLGADLIGFHIRDYAQNFLSCITKVLGCKSENNRLSFENRIVKVDCFPMGIDFDYFQEKSATGKLGRFDLKDKLGCRKIILSVDRLDYTKGIINRIRAYKMFLQQNPQWHNKVVLLLIVAPSRTELEVYQKHKEQIERKVDEVNHLLGTSRWKPITYEFNQLSLEEIIQCYNSSDVALVTPLKDGMNLIAKEFLASRIDKKGVLVLSELAGSSQELPEAEIINPYDIPEFARVIKRSLSISSTEQIQKNTKMRARIKEYGVVQWADDFISNTTKSRSENSSSKKSALRADLL